MSVEVLKQIWPEWQVEEKPLGRGSFGVVYKAVRRDHNVESYAAIKVISIPTDSSEIDSLRSEGLDINATRTYLQGIVSDFVSEIQLMESLKGVPNIVSVEDYRVVEKADEIGWDIYIRMELLTPFNTYICDKKLSEGEIIKLGCDICTALEICSQCNIIHRDIKPENIFINDFGYFKLGDFGIARKMENMTGGLSQKGTFNYMAPEVANSNDYDARVDIYSLGIVLYRLLNGNRLPFLDTEAQLLNPNERRNAVDRRLRGEPLPIPYEASPAMADLILRACAYDPNMRFASATEMKQALISVANGTYQMTILSDLDRTIPVYGTQAGDEQTVFVRKAPADFNQNPEQTVGTFGATPKKKKKLPIIITSVLAVVVLVCAGVLVASGMFSGNTDDSGDRSEIPSQISSENSNDSKFDEEEITAILSDAEALAAVEDYEGALVKVKEGLVTYPKSERLEKKLEEYENKYTDTILVKADTLIAENKLDDAESILEDAQIMVSDKSRIDEKIRAINNMRPVNLNDLVLIDSKYYEFKNEPFTDSFGNNYSGVHYYHDLFQSLNKQNPCSVFNLRGEYRSFSGSIVASQETNSDFTYYVTIYVDDKLTFSKTGISKTGGKVDFNVDVTNGQKLEIRMGTEAKLGHQNGELGIVNAVLTKNPDLSESNSIEETNSDATGLDQLTLIDSKYYEYKNELFIDSFGNNYSGVHYYYDLFQSLNNQSPCSVFNLRGKYRSFSGSIVASQETNSDFTYCVSIYVDDTLVLSKTGISKTGGKVDFNVDVTNGQKLEIRMGTEAKLGHQNGELGIVNAFVE